MNKNITFLKTRKEWGDFANANALDDEVEVPKKFPCYALLISSIRPKCKEEPVFIYEEDALTMYWNTRSMDASLTVSSNPKPSERITLSEPEDNGEILSQIARNQSLFLETLNVLSRRLISLEDKLNVPRGTPGGSFVITQEELADACESWLRGLNEANFTTKRSTAEYKEYGLDMSKYLLSRSGKIQE